MEIGCPPRAPPSSPRTRRSVGSRRPCVRSRSGGPSRLATSAANTSPRAQPSPFETATPRCLPTWPSCPSSNRPEVVSSLCPAEVRCACGDRRPRPRSESVTLHKHTNRLAGETSPYLRQHAHNPVDWYPWGVEALERARREDRPVLRSVGDSACHWCHVMERESFEDERIAGLMNQLFVNIKVDREERPDVDQIYMQAVVALTQHGGWPMTVFLTPDGVPFYGGTYF